MGGHFEITGADNPAVAAQNRLSARFGIEGSPNMLLIAGGEQEVLRRAEKLTAGLEAYRQRGVIKSIFSPTTLLPSVQTQSERASSLAGRQSGGIRAALLRIRCARTVFGPSRSSLLSTDCESWDKGNDPITLETAAKFLPPGSARQQHSQDRGRQLRRSHRLLCHGSRRDRCGSGQCHCVLEESIRSVRRVFFRQDEPRHAEPGAA